MSATMTAYAQTPVANRVKSVVRSLSARAKVVAKYTDNHRHCLYYIEGHRLYCRDVVTNRREEITFTNTSYNHILQTWLSPDGNFFFIAIDKGNLAPFYLDGGQELWRYDSRTHRSNKIGQGFHIEKHRDQIIIQRASRCINPTAEQRKQRWMAQAHHYDAYGKVLWAKDEYEVKPRQRSFISR